MALAAPSPNTVCVPRFHKSHAVQPAAAVRREGKVGEEGINGAAVEISFDLAINTIYIEASTWAKEKKPEPSGPG